MKEVDLAIEVDGLLGVLDEAEYKPEGGATYIGFTTDTAHLKGLELGHEMTSKNI